MDGKNASELDGSVGVDDGKMVSVKCVGELPSPVESWWGS